MRLLERESELAHLREAASAATVGGGRIVLVHGEAGVGKSSLIAALRSRPPAGSRILVGSCDALATPRTLGPLRDLRRAVGPRLAAALRGGDREELFAALIDDLSSQPGTVLVVEDMHWSDEATLDALRYLARRIDEIPAVLVMTYRDDELGQGHPLTLLLGDIRTSVRHLPVARLSPAAVAVLATERGLDPERLFALTRGNPYFVTEVVSSADAVNVPRTVVDTVMARMNRLDDLTREQVEQLAVIPSAVSSAELARLVAGGARVLRSAEERGLLTVRPDGVQFRHELTRRAVIDSLSASRRIELNARVLEVLRETDADAGRIVSHAIEAGDVDAIIHWAPLAAADAAESGAHRQAAAHLRAALEHAERYDPFERADLMQRYAIEVYTLGRAQEAVDVQTEVVRLRRELGDAVSLGASLRWVSRFHWISGDRRGAEETGREASDVLSSTENRAMYAFALSNESQLAMLAHDVARTIQLGERAIAVARESGATQALAHALTNVGTAHMLENREDGIAELEEAAAVAAAGNFMDDASRAHVNLVWSLLDQYRLDLAEQYLEPAIEQSQRSEVMGLWAYQQVERGRLHLARAQWDEALAACAALTEPFPSARCVALTVRGLVAVRRGDPGAYAMLDEAWLLAQDLGEWQRIGPVACARAEAALLRGDLESVGSIARPAYEEAVRCGAVNHQAELALYLRRAGEQVDVPEGQHPFAVQARGDVRRAAHLWRMGGAVYHQAAALAESTQEADLIEALTILDRIGATPLARSVRTVLRSFGARGIPRGPQATTRHNPAGLTDRQLDVLPLIAEGLTNSEIAEQLVLSVRTVDSHVAAILMKLGVSSRQEAARRGADLLRS
ncbi:ATP-binding protein [Microbacterium sp. DT81.1]|uniref:ATP-binding protein n=1 Tax=Microbacterium sp. DT81.1 TaxID=3393413 RepID=UPI003CF4CBB6